MAEDTKTCSLTDEEIRLLIAEHGRMLDHNNFEDRIERITYLNRRFKAKPKDDKPEDQPKAQMSSEETKATVSW